MIMAAEKFPCLELASWRPRRTNGVSSSPRAGRLEFQFKSKYKKKKNKTNVPAQTARQEDLLFTRGRFSLFVLFRPSND